MNLNNIENIAELGVNKKELMLTKGKIVQKCDEIRKNITHSMTDSFELVEKILSEYSLERLKGMSPNMINEVFINSEGSCIFDKNQFSPQMIKDFLIYLKTSDEIFEKIDKEINNIDQALEESQEEIKNIVDGSKSFNKTLKMSMNETINSSSDEKTIEKSKKILQALHDAETLEPLFILYDDTNESKVRNTLKEFNDKNKRNDIYKRFNKKCIQFSIDNKLVRCGGFETNYLPEEYHELKDLFVFIIARFFNYNCNEKNKLYIKTFMTQIIVFIRTIASGPDNDFYQADSVEIQVFIENVKSLLELFL